MSVRVVKHGSDPEVFTTVDIEVTVLSENTAAISGDRELVDLLIRWAPGNGNGWGLVTFDMETEVFTLRACRAVRIEGHRVAEVHFMLRE